MKIELKDLQKNPDQSILGKIDNDQAILLLKLNPLIKAVKNLDYNLQLKFVKSNLKLKIEGLINFELIVIDALDGEEFQLNDQIEWKDNYTFDQSFSDHANFILGQNFNLFDYILEQINLNIPINLTNKHDIISKIGSGWEFLSETDYQFYQERDNDPDPRWEKLDEFKINN